ncbi:MAG: hypothetical protein U1E76_20140 [Planctomycetota bacterium]
MIWGGQGRGRAGGADGGRARLQRQLLLGDFFIFNDYLLRLFWPAPDGSRSAGRDRAATPARRWHGGITEISRATSPIVNASSRWCAHGVDAPIEIHDLSFGRQRLAGVAQRIPPERGATLGLTGTGSGKSSRW